MATDGLAAIPNPSGKNPGAECTVDADCKSLHCNQNKCTALPTTSSKDGTAASNAPPSPTDGIKNGDESDVDCGGATAPKCSAGKGCNTDADCTTACNYQKKCADFPSCTGHEGGDTCGAGETGAADAKHESCCTVVKDGSVSIGKYYVTSGRVRAFVERFKGDIKGWVASAKPKGWNAAWTDDLPGSMAEAYDYLGPNNKRGCSVPNNGGRTYWQPSDADPAERSDFSQKVLDEKMQNCIPWKMAQAICHYDGGRLASGAELQAQITNHGTTTYPWGNSPAFTEHAQSDLIAHYYSYITPNPPADMRLQSNGTDPLDHSFWMPPPGRRPGGANKIGVQDAVGGMLAWTNDWKGAFYWTASWEEHPLVGHADNRLEQQTISTTPSTWPMPNASDATTAFDGYYAIGARCAFDN